MIYERVHGSDWGLLSYVHRAVSRKCGSGGIVGRPPQEIPDIRLLIVLLCAVQMSSY